MLKAHSSIFDSPHGIRNMPTKSWRANACSGEALYQVRQHTTVKVECMRSGMCEV